jgi:hypothetical protein
MSICEDFMRFHFPSSMVALAMVAGAIVLAPTATAQPSASKPTTAEPSAGPYRSAFSGYRRYGDEPVVPWKQANDEVGRIGGWKAYAKEAAGGSQEAGAPPAPDKPSSAPRSPAGASAPAGAHKQ